MRARKLTKKQRCATLIIGVLFVAGVAGWFFLINERSPAPRPRPALAKKAPAAGTTIGTRQNAQHQNEGKKPEPARGAMPPLAPAVLPPAASDTTLGDLTRLRGIKRVLQQEAEIADLRKRLAESQQPVVATPITPPIKLPPLDEAKPKKTRRSGPSVVSVQGVDGRLSADIRTADGRVVTVKSGERFNGGVLVVSRKSVSVRKNGDLTRIPFE